MTSTAGPHSRRQHWPVLKRLLSRLYLGVVVGLIALLAWHLDWTAVRAAIADLTLPVMLAATALAAASHLAYSLFDLIGRRYTGHPLPTGRVMAITFVSYVGTLNLGALIGAIGLRQRLYAHHGLSLSAMAQVFAVSIVTNWLGYLLLLGAVFAGPTYTRLREAVTGNDLANEALVIGLPSWPTPAWGGMLGVAALGIVCLYHLLCLWRSGATIQWRAAQLRTPDIILALSQTALSATSWLVNAGIIFVLLAGEVSFDRVLLASLVAAFIGLVTHIPAGVGVLEATYIVLLAGLVPVETIIATLLAYRFLFYLAPIPLAGLLWWRLEQPLRET